MYWNFILYKIDYVVMFWNDLGVIEDFNENLTLQLCQCMYNVHDMWSI